MTTKRARCGTPRGGLYDSTKGDALMSAKELPAVRLVTIDGRKEVYVPLVGKHGTGREMLVDGDVWRRIKGGGGMRCRVTMRRDVRLYADHPDLGPLARWILDAPSGEQVRYGNGDWFDLRRCNLNMAKESRSGETSAGGTRTS